jgi:hypothetical protein
MAKQSNLRSQIQALKNQAKARGHENVPSSKEELEAKAFVMNKTYSLSHRYVYRDLFVTFLFVIFALLFLFLVSIKLSNIAAFGQLRNALYIGQFSF